MSSKPIARPTSHGNTKATSIQFLPSLYGPVYRVAPPISLSEAQAAHFFHALESA
jgi:hypothetical protein